MSAEEFILIPKFMFTQSKSNVDQVLTDVTKPSKAVQLSLLQRNESDSTKDIAPPSPPQDTTSRSRQQTRSTSPPAPKTPRATSTSTETTKEPELNLPEPLKTIKDSVLGELPLTSDALLKRSSIIYDKIASHKGLVVNKDGYLLVDGEFSGLEVSTFLYALQIPSKQLTEDEKHLLNILQLPEHLVVNKYAKEISAARKQQQWKTFKR